VDVAVVGGGIAGVTAARLLQEGRRRVALLEARRIGAGDTGHTTAHLTELLDAGYATLRSHFGEEGATLAARSQRDAIDRVERFVREDGISCGFSRVPGFRYADVRDEVESLDDELRAMREAGVDAARADVVPLPYPVAAAIRVERQAQLHPVAYLAGMLERFVAAGGLVFEGTRATRISEGEPCTVETPGGAILCRDVVVMTHAPVSSRFALHSKMAPYRTYAVAARLPSLPPPGLYYDSQDPYHYIRTQETSDGTFLVVGGDDHKAGHEEDTRRSYASLEGWVQTRFPGAAIAHRWSGQVWEPADGLAFIGTSSGARHVWVGTGFSGTGMTFGTLAAMIVSDGILGRKSPYARLYDATRVKPLAQARAYLSENADVAAQLAKDRLSRGEARSVAEVPPGEGRLVRVDGKMAAVHRSEDGAVTAVSAACTHLGCHVRWNRAETCWDCPCHGSRFDAAGEVLSGPATRRLAPVELPQAGESASR
jgi:glycine/D-amino acid oxidase-like deaminating enzyme/nitrite reductase/ring-hydroxylating ferredoxin subunit